MLGFEDLGADPRLATNNDRVKARAWFMPILRERLQEREAAELARLMEQAGLPFAPIRRPEDLLADEHLEATGGLADMVLPDGERAGQVVKGALLPLSLDGQRLGVRLDPPVLGSHTEELLGGLGLSSQEIAALQAQGLVA